MAKPRLTARQGIINGFIESARHRVIYAELQRDFLTELNKQVSKGEVSEETISEFLKENISVDAQIEYYNNQYNFALYELNYYKNLRKQEQDKAAIKFAQRLRRTIPNELRVKVDLEKEK